MTRILLTAVVLLCATACSQTTKHEICGNGLDDDGNGYIDCFDMDCAGQDACVSSHDAGYFGTCAKCSMTCSKQSDCLEVDVLHDWPIPLCAANKCQSLNDKVEVRFELDTKSGWAGIGVNPQTVTVRFVKKLSSLGAAVTCASLEAVAGQTEADVDGIEKANQFLLQGFDSYRLMNAMLGQGINLPFIRTTTGSDYLLWIELWAGAPQASTRYPQGSRLGHGCFAAAAATAPVIAADNCPSINNDAGVCRTFKVVMPGPDAP